MYAACFTLSGWAGYQKYILSGDKLMDVMDAFNDVQDLVCLDMMAHEEEGENPGEVEKLHVIAHRYYNREVRAKDIQAIDIHLSVGIIKCDELIRGKDAVEKLKEKYPEAIVR